MSTVLGPLPWWSPGRLAKRYRWALHMLVDLPELARGWTLLLFGLRSHRPLELWIGDSHALAMNRELTTAHLSAGGEGQVIWHLGPRLMYTIARAGHLPKVHRAARLIRRFGRTEHLTLFVCAGEIDVRCHLVPRSHDPDFNLDWVHEYVSTNVALAEEMGVSTLVVVMHGPQSGNIPESRIYRPVGSLSERVAMSERLRARVHSEVDSYDGPLRVLVLDATDLLAGPDGSMNQQLSRDGVHTNAEGISMVRRRVRELCLAG